MALIAFGQSFPIADTPFGIYYFNLVSRSVTLVLIDKSKHVSEKLGCFEKNFLSNKIEPKIENQM